MTERMNGFIWFLEKELPSIGLKASLPDLKDA